MPKQFDLKFDESFCESEALRHLDDLLFVARTMVPPGFEEVFRQRAVYVNAHTTVAIEGNQISAEDALRVAVEGADSSKPEEVEIENIRSAYDLINQLSGDQTVKIDQGLIRTLNSIVLSNIDTPEADARGRYRTRAIAVADRVTREVLYIPPPSREVGGYMEMLTDNIDHWRTQYPPAITAALAHFGIVSVHPFEDGNGRTARLAAHMALESAGESVESLLQVNEAILEYREEYYQVLRETQGPRFKEVLNVQPFVEFHTKALIRSAERLHTEAVNFARHRERITASAEGALNERQVTALMFIIAVGRPVSSSLYARMAKSSQKTAVADLNDLVQGGSLRRIGRGPSTRYSLNLDDLEGGEEEETQTS